jgi:hypothetical protein
MIVFYNLETGKVTKYLSAPVSEAEMNLSEGEGFLESNVIPVENAYVNEGVVVTSGKPPSRFHVWDWPTKTWIPDLPAAREAKKQEVASELIRRLYLPCNGFDADRTSRERISGMIARLQRGDGLPAGWMGWRDAENNMHWITDDAAAVLTNLTALSRAIEDREQALLVASWTHKANIAALTDIDAIIGYDVTAGWPS